MSTCIKWDGPTDRDGYGRMAEGELAHRHYYVRTVGPIPSGLELDHLCRNRACVNPEHLEPVTHAENMLRRSISQTHCKNGHEFTPENTYIRPGRDGRRTCRTCQRASVANYRKRKTA